MRVPLGCRPPPRRGKVVGGRRSSAVVGRRRVALGLAVHGPVAQIIIKWTARRHEKNPIAVPPLAFIKGRPWAAAAAESSEKYRVFLFFWAWTSVSCRDLTSLQFCVPIGALFDHPQNPEPNKTLRFLSPLYDITRFFTYVP